MCLIQITKNCPSPCKNLPSILACPGFHQKVPRYTHKPFSKSIRGIFPYSLHMMYPTKIPRLHHMKNCSGFFIYAVWDISPQMLLPLVYASCQRLATSAPFTASGGIPSTFVLFLKFKPPTKAGTPKVPVDYLICPGKVFQKYLFIFLWPLSCPCIIFLQVISHMYLSLFTRKTGKHINRTVISQQPCPSYTLFQFTFNRIQLHFL